MYLEGLDKGFLANYDGALLNLTRIKNTIAEITSENFAIKKKDLDA